MPLITQDSVAPIKHSGTVSHVINGRNVATEAAETRFAETDGGIAYGLDEPG